MTAEKAGVGRRFWQAFLKVAGYLTRVFEPGLRWQARVWQGVKTLMIVGFIGMVLLAGYTIVLIPQTPDVSDLRKAQIEQPSQVLSADGKVLATFSRMNSEWVPLDRVSPHVVKALIATEDHRFYEHHGVDVFRTLSSVVWTMLGRQQGGSTITQQLARNRYLKEIGRSRSIARKLKEMITAVKIERAYSKKEILETYLNTVPFFYNAHGIEMASRIYFEKPSSKLNVLESATLIGMLKGSSYYNPVLNPERSLQRRNVVLAQMVKRKVLSQERYNRLKKQDLKLNFDRYAGVHGMAPHFAQHVRKWLIEWADLQNRNIYADGFVVHTTIDSRLQAVANQAVRRQMEMLQAIADVEWGTKSGKLISRKAAAYASLRQRTQPFSYFWSAKPELVEAFIKESFAYAQAIESGLKPAEALAQLKKDEKFMARLREEKTRLQAGFVAVDPTTGHVKAWVGSRDFGVDQYDHVIIAQRQPGSTFKPFVYGAALEQGMQPDRKFTEKAVEIKLGDGTVWRPTDLSPQHGREVTMREGLVHSRNTITAQIMQDVGPGKAADFARRMGVNQSKLDVVPSLALGTSPVTLLEMVSAYSTIANRGEYHKPIYITRVTDKNGNELMRFDNEAQRETKRVVSESVVDALIDMMRGVIKEGTGTRIQSEFGIMADVAGKTGTTQKNTDGWFILTHPKLVAGAWVGFNDSRVVMRSSYWGQGGHNALNIVGDFYKQTFYSGPNNGPIAPEYSPARSTVVETLTDTFSKWFGFGKPQEAEKKPSTPIIEKSDGGKIGAPSASAVSPSVGTSVASLPAAASTSAPAADRQNRQGQGQ